MYSQGHRTHTQLLDTRKTAPGLRVLDKMAVKDGGGTNHRMGLYDMAMIKDNHIKMAGGITKAVEQVRANITPEIKIEVETTNLDEVKEAIAAGADGLMVEVHSDPECALCDGAQSLTPAEFDALCKKVFKIREVLA